MNHAPHAVVGMSGGVDSSVTAHLLKSQGYRVTGVFMRNWQESDGSCNSGVDAEDVARVCAALQIDHYTFDFAKEYWNRVFRKFLEGYRAGLTPNPDVLCNREIKFRALFDKSLALGADYLATGHYCQIDRTCRGSSLLKGRDREKDQSYFLHMVSGATLNRVLFPLGGWRKPRVRELAAQLRLPIAAKKDSTGLCFVGKRRFRPFLASYLEEKPGPIESISGQKLGEHRGAHLYTIGQRRGLELGGHSNPWFVVDKDRTRNALIVANGIDHPDLLNNALWAIDPHWVLGAPESLPLRCRAKIRYRHPEAPCSILACDQRGVKVQFDRPQWAITPGQSVVFYDQEICLGGAEIKARWYN